MIEKIEMNCEKHGEVIGRIIHLGEAGSTAPFCSKCEEESLQEIKNLNERRDQERQEYYKRKQIENSLLSAMIPPRFQQHSFDTFMDKTPEIAKRKERCRLYAENFEENLSKGTSMIFVGNTGTGKTHLACAIANHIIKNLNKTALFTTTIDAVRRVKETFKKSSKETERQAVASFLLPDLLILDEVGVQFGTDTELMILFEILNKRYEHMKPSILLSNLNVEKLKEFVGDRILDRMRENNGKIIVFEFESHRKTTLSKVAS